MALLPVRPFVGWLCDCSRYWDYCRARGAAGVQKLEAANLGPPDRSVRERAPALPGRTRAQILGTCGSASYRPAMAYTEVPSAVGTLRPAAAPRLAPAAPPPRRRRPPQPLPSCPARRPEAKMLPRGLPLPQLVRVIPARPATH